MPTHHFGNVPNSDVATAGFELHNHTDACKLQPTAKYCTLTWIPPAENATNLESSIVHMLDKLKYWWTIDKW